MMCIIVCSYVSRLIFQDFNGFCFPMRVKDNVSPFSDIHVQTVFDANASKWSQDVAPCFQDVPDGEHTFEVRAKDKAGNVSAPIKRTFTVKTK